MTDTENLVLSPKTIVGFIGDIFHRRGADSYLGEDVTMSEHMLQGAYLAEQAGADDQVIAAALLHDIGHYTNEFPEDALEKGVNNYHDVAGAEVIKDFFPALVIDSIRYHVAAKRYLCAVEGDYFDRLSDASVHTLNLQGGPMSQEEVKEFQTFPHLETIVQVRRWDDEGKVAGVSTPEFSYYAPLLQRIVDAHCEF
ncbi:MAG: HD domain-containing protein [Sneathiella sp.]|nr:HD domain-containing protein [Sneathiella sp.]